VRDKTLIIANWKMNLTVHEASLYLHKLDQKVKNHRNVEIALAPTMLCLQPLSLQVDHKKFKLAAQNFYWRDEGAYTGEVSAHQLHGLVKYAIVGHSERRHVFHEHDKEFRAKMQAAIRNHITPVLCVGETAAERAAGETAHVIHDQIIGGLANLTAEDAEHIVIAYEPVWALSSGKDFGNHPTPTPEDATKAIKEIRHQVEFLFGKKVGEELPVLYGGSVNSHNAAGFMTQATIDGFLIGGASLIAEEFTEIIKIAHERGK
jgi:triosephosphate isomerase